ncbi:hypothetical protein GQ457_02G029640 [Hibiscus cannabinus]
MASSSKPFTNKSISIRLDETNYLLWRQHVLFAIESLALASHIDGTISVPLQYTMLDGVKTVNAEFVVYKQQDSALCSWLLSSISTSILPSLVNCRIAFEIWEKIQKVFSVSSTTKIMHLHCSLKNLRKRDPSMREYLAQIQAVCDSLAACGNPLTETMHISAILSGLPSQYEPVIAVITSSQQSYTFDGVCSVLLDTEARQQETHLVNLVQAQSYGSGIFQGPNYSSPSYGPSYGLDRSFSGYVGQVSSPNVQSGASQRIQDPRSYDGCYNINFVEDSVDFHKADSYLSFGVSEDLSGTVAFVSNGAAQAVSDDVGWFPDSGATTHLTPDAGIILNSLPYTRIGKISVANGMTVPISRVGSGSMLTNSRPLMLNNLLHVPNIKKNLLSVSKFTRDNNVSIEFFPDSCAVKDLRTCHVMLQGLENDGLYKLSSADSCSDQQNCAKAVSCKNVLSVSCNDLSIATSVCKETKECCNALCSTELGVKAADLEVWHRRLGHPSNSTLLKMIKLCIPFDGNKIFGSDISCVACKLGKSCKLPFSLSSTVYVKPLQLIHIDLWGPAPLISNNSSYYISFVDVYTRYTWIYFLARKFDACKVVVSFIKFAERQLDRKVLSVQTDCGTEFKPLGSFFEQQGIQLRLTCPHTSW